jgi:hypothetical protein
MLEEAVIRGALFDRPSARRRATLAGAPETQESAVYRRKEPRYEAAKNLLWMQWWEGGEYLGRSARLVNVSRTGAMIVAAALFREDQQVRIYLEEPDLRIRVEATVRGVVEGRAGMHQVRLEFLEPCPDEFLEAAATGFESWLACVRPKI